MRTVLPGGRKRLYPFPRLSACRIVGCKNKSACVREYLLECRIAFSKPAARAEERVCIILCEICLEVFRIAVLYQIGSEVHIFLSLWVVVVHINKLINQFKPFHEGNAKLRGIAVNCIYIA